MRGDIRPKDALMLMRNMITGTAPTMPFGLNIFILNDVHQHENNDCS